MSGENHPLGDVALSCSLGGKLAANGYLGTSWLLLERSVQSEVSAPLEVGFCVSTVTPVVLATCCWHVPKDKEGGRFEEGGLEGVRKMLAVTLLERIFHFLHLGRPPGGGCHLRSVCRECHLLRIVGHLALSCRPHPVEHNKVTDGECRQSVGTAGVITISER